MLKVILICVAIVILLVIIIIRYKKKGNFILKKIDVAENEVSVCLNKKKELLKDSIPLLVEELHLEDFLEDFVPFFEKEANNFEVYEFLNKAYDSFKSKIYGLEDELKDEQLCKNINKLKKCDIELSGVVKYYNDSCTTFNEFIRAFPVNILRVLFRYNKKVLYNENKKEIFDILNDK